MLRNTKQSFKGAGIIAGIGAWVLICLVSAGAFAQTQPSDKAVQRG